MVKNSNVGQTDIMLKYQDIDKLIIERISTDYIDAMMHVLSWRPEYNQLIHLPDGTTTAAQWDYALSKYFNSISHISNLNFIMKIEINEIDQIINVYILPLIHSA
jgi:hypothetical protein